MSAMLAYLPLYDPLYAWFPAMSDYWLWLVLPLALAISVVYKGTRVERLDQLPREALVMTAQMVMVMVVAAVVLAVGVWAYIFWFGPLVHQGTR